MIPHDWWLFAGSPEQQHPFIILILSAGALQPDIRQLERTEKSLFFLTPLCLSLSPSLRDEHEKLRRKMWKLDGEFFVDECRLCDAF
jgi:hypothetical protein